MLLQLVISEEYLHSRMNNRHPLVSRFMNCCSHLPNLNYHTVLMNLLLPVIEVLGFVVVAGAEGGVVAA